MFAIAAVFADGAASVESVTVATKAPHNAEATFWCHVPTGYDAKRKKPYPVLVYFGGRLQTGSGRFLFRRRSRRANTGALRLELAQSSPFENSFVSLRTASGIFGILSRN